MVKLNHYNEVRRVDIDEVFRRAEIDEGAREAVRYGKGTGLAG